MSSPPPPSIVQARGLGRHELRVGDRVITAASDRLFTLGFHLCVRAGEHIPRDELATLFWDSADLRRSRHSLRQMLYRLRQHGFPLEDDMLAVHLPERFVDCDVREALRPGWDLQAPADQVIAGGDLIAGGPRSYTSAFHEWYDALEARVRAQVRRAALRHLSLAKLEGRWAHVEDWALHVLRHDPLNEEATLARAEAMAMSGSKSRALDVLDAYLAELGDRTAQIGLPARVLRKRIAAHADNENGSPESSETADRPLVGREADLALLNSTFGWTHSLGHNSMLLHGPAGIGKTRFVEEISSCAALAGFQVLTLRFLDSEYSLYQTNIRRFLSELISVPGSAGAKPDALNLLRYIVSEDSPPTPLGLPLQSTVSDNAVIAAVAEVLAATTEETRLFIICEDVHAAPIPFCSAFLGALVTLASSRTKILLTSRTNAGALAARGVRIENVGRYSHFLGPLSQQATEQLCKASLRHYATPHDRGPITAIASASGGNPLFALSLAKQYSITGAINKVPANVAQLITSRLTQIASTDLAVLHTILLLGPHASISRLRPHLEAHVLANSVAAFESEGILHLHSNGTLALHSCWADILNQHLRGAHRAALAHEIAARLTSNDEQENPPAIAWHAARLFSAAGERGRALTLLCRVSDLLSSRGLASEALDALTEANSLASTPAEMRAVGLRRALINHSLGDLAEAHKITTDMLALRCDGSEESTATRLLLAAEQTDSAWRLDMPFGDFLSRLVDALEDQRVNAHVRQQAAFTAIRIAFNDRTSPHIARILASTRAASQRQGPSPFGALTCLVAAAEHADVQGVHSLDDTLEAMEISRLHAEVQCLILRYRSQALRWTGDFSRADILARRAFLVATGSALINETSILAVQIAFMNLDRDLLNDAEHWIRIARGQGTSLGRERDTAIWHAQTRLQIQSDDTASAYAFLIAKREEIRFDSLLKRQCAAASMLSYAAAFEGDVPIALEMLELSSRALSQETPSLQLDLPCELCYHSAVRLGMDQKARALIRDYAKRRAASFSVPVAPFYRALQSEQRSLPMPPT